MRKGNNPRLIFDSKQRLMGVSLGADYCAEHEWGIRRLQEDFGLNAGDTTWGIRRRKVNIVPVQLREFAVGNHWGFGYQHVGNPIEHLRGELSGVGLRGAWSEDDFAVISDVPATKKHLKTIFKALREKNGLLTFASGQLGGFENNGLCLAIADRIPRSIRRLWYDADKDRYVLANVMKDSGIEKLLAERGKRYFALSPRRMRDGSIKFNLHPLDQESNNWGFFSLGELQQWAEGYGPIPKKPVKVI